MGLAGARFFNTLRSSQNDISASREHLLIIFHHARDRRGRVPLRHDLVFSAPREPARVDRPNFDRRDQSKPGADCGHAPNTWFVVDYSNLPTWRRRED